MTHMSVLSGGASQGLGHRGLLGVAQEASPLQQKGQRLSLGIAQHAIPQRMRNKKRKLSNLETIFELDCEDLEEIAAPAAAVGPQLQSLPLPHGLPESLTEPLSLATSVPW